MRWSYRIAKVFGIDVRIHVTFLLIVAYFAFEWGALREPKGLGGGLYGVLLVLLLFLLVLIHELTHSRVALHYGVGVKNITLLPIGGVSAMEEIPRDPRRELVISVVGPLSNVVIAILMAALAPLFFDVGAIFRTSNFSDLLLSRTVEGTYLYVFVVNLSLAVFNLLPAFPMDGGRVFRALLAMRLGRPRATRIAIVVGQMLALGLGLYGLMGGGIFLILIAVFIFFGAQAEGAGEDLAQVLGDLRVRHVVNCRVETASPEQAIGELAARLFHIYQEDFPVVDPDGEVVGLLTRDRLISMLGQHGPDFPVIEAMRTDFPRCGQDDLAVDVLNRMRAGQVKAAPVMDGGKLVGMVSMEDLAEVYALLSAGGSALTSRVTSDGVPGRWVGGTRV